MFCFFVCFFSPRLFVFCSRNLVVCEGSTSTQRLASQELQEGQALLSLSKVTKPSPSGARRPGRGLQVCQNVNVGSDVKLMPRPTGEPRAPPQPFSIVDSLSSFSFSGAVCPTESHDSRLCYFNQNPVQTILAIIFQQKVISTLTALYPLGW